MADGFAVSDGAAVAGHGARLAAHGARLSAVGAGPIGGKGLGLLLQEGGEGALGQAAGGGRGDLLQGEQIDVQAGPGVAEGAAGDNLAPLGGGIADVLEFLGCQMRGGHEQSCLGLTPSDRGAFLQPFYG